MKVLSLTPSTYDSYELQLMLSKLEPNFFISKEYFEAAKWRPVTATQKWVGQYHTTLVVLDEDGVSMLPSFGKINQRINCQVDVEGQIPIAATSTLFDREYIYNPENFLHPVGGKWSVHRKNINKFKSTYGEYTYEPISPGDAVGIFQTWLKNNEGMEEFYDVDSVLRYLFSDDLKRHSLMGLKVGVERDEWIGFNAHDENYMFVNFRYSFASDFSRGVADVLWHEFMKSIADKGKYVNDGGDLGNIKLAKFKRRMNPVQVHNRYSIKHKGGADSVSA